MTEPFQKKTICLNMIVKNEEKIIVHTLEKLLNKIRWDYWVICDTGSTDNTREVITEFFKSVNIPGELINHEWKDFGHNRTEALKCAFEKTDYVFIFDADDEICLDFKLPENLWADAYLFQFGHYHDYNCYTRSLLVNNRQKWKYVGVLHEVIVPDGFANTSEVIRGNYFVVSGRSGDRNTNNPDKYLKDAKILEKAYQESKEINDPLYERYAFYCANSYFDHGDVENAIKWYKITLTHNNWCQEKYVCCMKLFQSYEKLGQRETGFYYCVKSISYDKERAEGLHQLIVHYCAEGMPDIAFAYYRLIQDYLENRYANEIPNPNNHKLFVDNSILNFHLPYYMIIVSDRTRNYDVGLRMYEIIFQKKQKNISDFFTRCLLFNLQFFLDKISQEKLSDFVNQLKTYISFLEESGYKLYEYDFMPLYEKYGVENKYIIRKLEEENQKDYEKCKNSNKILFFTGWSGGINWNQTYSLKNALGGSETAVAYLTKFLPKKYQIYVAGELEEEVVDNVYYVNINNLQNLISNNSFHSVVVSRYIGFFEMYPNLKSYQNFIWVHDIVLNSFGSQLNDQDTLKKWNNRINSVICLTEWHKKYIEQVYPTIKDKIRIINNGIKVEMFSYPVVKKLNSFVYTSCPERGLKRLLKLWPSILEKIPDAELNISFYVNFPRNDEEVSMQKTIESFSSVKYLGNLGPEKLYELMSKSEYWLYPTDWPETSCITALEMLKSEVICIYYPLAGLPWTMQDCGIQIKEGEELNTILNLTEDKKQELRTAGRIYAESCSWENRANLWNKMMGLHNSQSLENSENITLQIQEVNNTVEFENGKIKIINLERRLDRKNEMIRKLKEMEIENYEFFKAVDGNLIEPSIELKKLFEGNDFYYRRGVSGAALSHLKLWRELIDENDNCNFYIIFEDDVVFFPDFKNKLKLCVNEFVKKSMDKLYIGANSIRTINRYTSNLKFQKGEGELCDGNYGYIISKSAAKKMIDHFNKTSMKRAIDYTQLYRDLLENVYFVNEFIVFTCSYQAHGEIIEVDSDIQKDYYIINVFQIKDEDPENNDNLFENYYKKFMIPQVGDGISITQNE